MGWKEVPERILQDDQNKWDRTAKGQELTMGITGMLELSNGNGKDGSYRLSDLAMAEMCQRLDVPVKYFWRLPDRMKAFVANYDLMRLPDKSFLVRGKGEWVRAFLSSEYVAYNNSEILNGHLTTIGRFSGDH